jgi:hypothetical protein
MAKALTEFVVGHFADVAARSTKRRDARNRVRHRTTRHLNGGPHGVVKGIELILLDEGHRRFHEP